jgi:hypothetical protein
MRTVILEEFWKFCRARDRHLSRSTTICATTLQRAIDIPRQSPATDISPDASKQASSGCIIFRGFSRRHFSSEVILFMVRFFLPSSISHLLVSVFFLFAVAVCAAQTKPADSTADILVLANGDTLHGKFVNEVGGKVNFHSDPLGDISVSWDKIKELHSAQKVAVLDKTVKLRGREKDHRIPTGTVDVAGESVTVHGEGGPWASIPVKNAEYIVDRPTLDRQLFHEPSFLTGWNGAATAGATLVSATQNQYTVSGSLGLVRAVPTVAWLTPRNRTSADFSGSYGKITEPGTTPLKSAIYHVDGERDQYFDSSRVFALGQVAFDHNFAQDLQLQQIYGGGVGWTFLKQEKQEADLKATIQYEKREFIQGPSGTGQDLVGSTFAFSYALHAKLLSFNQNLEFIPAYNAPSAYSASETNTVSFPAFKNFGFSLGTIDSYLNNPPASTPPTKRNSFQFTMGLSYAIKSKY